MNEKACLASHVHPFFVFTCFPSNPDYRKKNIRKTTRKMCGIRRGKKNYKTTTTTTFTCEAFKWCLLFSNVCFLPFIQTLWRYYFAVKLFLAQLFTPPKALIVNCCWALEHRRRRRAERILFIFMANYHANCRRCCFSVTHSLHPLLTLARSSIVSHHSERNLWHFVAQFSNLAIRRHFI